MPLQLDHTIPAYDKEKSAKFIARIFGLEYNGAWGHFAPVKINDALTLDFDNSDNPHSNHYAFLASDEEFDAALQRVKDEGIPFGSGPRSRTDGEINHGTWDAGSTSSARTDTCGSLRPIETTAISGIMAGLGEGLYLGLDVGGTSIRAVTSRPPISEVIRADSRDQPLWPPFGRGTCPSGAGSTSSAPGAFRHVWEAGDSSSPPTRTSPTGLRPDRHKAGARHGRTTTTWTRRRPTGEQVLGTLTP